MFNRITHTLKAMPPQRIRVLLGLLLFAVLLLLYLFGSWETNRQRTLTQLEALVAVAQSNTRLLQQQLQHQLLDLRTDLQNHSTDFDGLQWLRQKQKPRPQHSHLALYHRDGQLLASSFDSADPQQTPPDLSNDDLNLLRHQQHAGFVSTVQINKGHYLPYCMPMQQQQTALIACLLTSTSSNGLQWQAAGSLEHSAQRIISGNGVLLIASPLPVSRQQMLGKNVSERQRDDLNLRTDVYRETTLAYFSNKTEFDGIKRLGVVSFDPQLQLLQMVSLPMASLLSLWLEDIIWPMLFLLILLAGSWQLYRYVLSNTLQKEHRYSQESRALGEKENVINMLMSNIPGSIYQISLPEHLLNFITSGDLRIIADEDSDRAGRQSLLAHIHPDDQERYLQEIDSHCNSRTPYKITYRVQTLQHELKWIMDRGQVLFNAQQPYRLEGLLIDITDHTLSQQHVEFLATRDPLTELFNRYYFNDELINSIERMQPNKGKIALLFIDLDRFKTVNDSLGHQVGDRLLKLVADRLRHLIDPQYMIARLGGDEFIVMVSDPENSKKIEQLADKIIKAVSQTYKLDHYKLSISCSIGISVCPDDSSESYILLRNADTAMYQAKSRGGNCYQFYTEEMNQKANSRLTLENELRRAVKNQEFELYYQPQVNTFDNTLLGAEALIRWIHPSAGVVSPADFIPIAEETGLIREIGDWALMEACKQFREWNDTFSLDMTISVNVSVRQLDDAFVLRTQEILNISGLDPKYLELEITESLLLDNVQENLRILDNINKLGVRFAMDDFGTGYSSLSYLKQFPISKLKIDRAFINEINSDPEDEAIVRAIIALAKTLKLELVAEGVENHQQLTLLQALACDSYQGYYFSKPVPAAVFRQNYLEQSPPAEKMLQQY